MGELAEEQGEKNEEIRGRKWERKWSEIILNGGKSRELLLRRRGEKQRERNFKETGGRKWFFFKITTHLLQSLQKTQFSIPHRNHFPTLLRDLILPRKTNSQFLLTLPRLKNIFVPRTSLSWGRFLEILERRRVHNPVVFNWSDLTRFNWTRMGILTRSVFWLNTHHQGKKKLLSCRGFN